MSIPTEKKQAVEKLLEYLPFFENTNRDDICRWVTEEKSPDGTMPVTYPMYRDELIDFVNLVYENDHGHFLYADNGKIVRRRSGAGSHYLRH